MPVVQNEKAGGDDQEYDQERQVPAGAQIVVVFVQEDVDNGYHGQEGDIGYVYPVSRLQIGSDLARRSDFHKRGEDQAEDREVVLYYTPSQQEPVVDGYADNR